MALVTPPPNLGMVQSVGDFSIIASHPLVGAGAQISMNGFKVDEDVVDSEQLMDNSKVIALIGGITVTITNNVTAGMLRFNAASITNNPLTGDIVAWCHFLQALGDNAGGLWRISFTQNGVIRSMSFFTVTVRRCPPLKLRGNDLAIYPVQLNFANYVSV